MNLYVDDCLESLHINSKLYEEIEYPFCLYAGAKTLSFNKYLKAGENLIEINISNHVNSGVFNFTPIYSNQDISLIKYIFFFITIIFIVKLWRIIFPQASIIYSYALICGVLVRTVFFLSKSMTYGENDFDGHINFIQYLLNNQGLPPFEYCWECKQPPLYYLIVACWGRITSNIEVINYPLLSEFYGISYAFSLASLFLALAIGVLLVAPGKKYFETCYPFLISSFPGMIHMTAKINNDILLIFLSFLLITLVLVWKNKPNFYTYTLVLLIFFLALLTKKSALLLGVFITAVVICTRLLRTTKLTYLLALILTTSMGYWAMNAQYKFDFVAEALTDLQTHWIPTKAEHFFTFSPSRIFEIKHNLDLIRAGYFWDSLLLTAYFEYLDFRGAMSGLLKSIKIIGIISVFFLLLGVLNALLRKQTWEKELPILLLIGSFIAAVIHFRLSLELWCCDHARYITPVMPLILYYIAKGFEHIKNIWYCRIFVMTHFLLTTGYYLFIYISYLNGVVLIQ